MVSAEFYLKTYAAVMVQRYEKLQGLLRDKVLLEKKIQRQVAAGNVDKADVGLLLGVIGDPNPLGRGPGSVWFHLAHIQRGMMFLLENKDEFRAELAGLKDARGLRFLDEALQGADRALLRLRWTSNVLLEERKYLEGLLRGEVKPLDFKVFDLSQYIKEDYQESLARVRGVLALVRAWLGEYKVPALQLVAAGLLLALTSTNLLAYVGLGDIKDFVKEGADVMQLTGKGLLLANVTSGSLRLLKKFTSIAM